MVDSNNRTSYGIQDQGVRYFWVGYHLLVLISSLVGDTTILIASIKYKAIKLSDFILTIIHHIAFTDLALSLLYVLPGLISLIENRWILGETFCYIRDPLSYYFLPANLLLISAMTTGKWVQLKWPLRSWTWTHQQAKKICMAIWTICLFGPVVVVVLARKNVYFDYIIYNCCYIHLLENDQENVLIQINYVLWLFIPNLVVISTCSMTLVEARNARREGERLNWRGVSTVVLTAVSFSVSTLPTLLFIAVNYFIGMSYSTEIESRRSVAFLKELNIMANIYIYTLTVPSFRYFLEDRVRIVARTICQYTPLLDQHDDVRDENSPLIT